MPAKRVFWINWLAAVVGGVVLARGVRRYLDGYPLLGASLAVLGFLILGWAVFDWRKFSRGTAESEVDGGRTIE